LTIKATLSPNVTGSTSHVQNSAADFATGRSSTNLQGIKATSRVECRTEFVLPRNPTAALRISGQLLSLNHGKGGVSNAL